METSKEERLQLALDAAQLGTFVWYVEDRAEPDQRMLELFNLPSDGTLSLSAALTSMIHPDDRGRYAAAVADALDPAGNRELRQDIRVLQAHGGYHWVAVTARANFEGDPPTPTRLVGVAADVTGRYAAEARRAFLFELSDALRSLTDPLEIKAHAVDLLGRHLMASRALYLDVVHEPDSDYYIAERDFHQPAVAGSVGRYRADDFGATLFAEVRAGRTITVTDVSTDPRLSEDERLAYPATGVRAFVTVPLVKDGSHAASLTLHQTAPRTWEPAEIALMEEVAERTWTAVERARAEQELRESELRFRELVEVTAQLVWVGRLDGSVEFANDNWLTSTGVEPAGNDHRSMLFIAAHPDDTDRLRADWAAAEAHGAAFEGELRLRQRTGEYRWFLVRIVPLHDGTGSVLKWFGVATDIDDRRRADDVLREQERRGQRSRARMELLADVIGELDRASTVEDGLRSLVGLLAPGFADRAAVTGTPDPAGIPIATGRDSAVTLVVAFDDPAGRPYLDEDLAFLEDLAARVGVALTGISIRQEEHRVALQLQRALLPRAIVSRPDAAVCAQYEAGSVALEVGGDWYDAFTLPDGRIAVTVGDVVGHGLDAAIAMGSLRVGIRALAPHSTGPGALLSQFDRFAVDVDGADFATACYAVYDPATRQLCYASAGHPPMLVVDAAGGTRWLTGGRSGPLNGNVDTDRPDATDTLEAGATLVLYSDGLIERRREPITVGLDRLEQAATGLHDLPIEDFCARLIDALGTDHQRTDDVVVLCLRPPSPRFRHELAPDAHELRRLRRSLTDWGAQRHVPAATMSRLLLAVGEAASNAIEHAYRDRSPATITVEADHEDGGDVVVIVTDAGSWRPAPREPGDRGRGTDIMRKVSAAYERTTTPAGTTVKLRFSKIGPAA
ncbi:SpoIIE family protein phosphatase [Catellatospora vulcania]|uniref:SpoIIE family protein phosphatase n=1 Tax=Catellatospora vulcania TaxID=1460450 RepID=UPI0012D3CFED|nr:SpoIIE family protein phosphatase [Catellatospora vulcania]